MTTKTWLDALAPSPLGRLKRRLLSTASQPTVSGLLAGRHALITGAGRNSGLSIAREMARQGAAVSLVDIDRERCEAAESLLSEAGASVRGFVADVADEQAMDDVVSSVGRNAAPVDILVNNVGVRIDMASPDLASVDAWRKTFDVNVIGPMHLTHRVVQAMLSSGVAGSVIFITSIHVSVPGGFTSYSASKAALAMAIRELALKLARHGIRVNGIAPGWIACNGKEEPLEHRDTPLYRTSVPPQYIARAAVFLSSDYFSHHTTGTTLTVDGALGLHSYLSQYDVLAP